MSDKKKFIVIIFQDDLPEYTIDEVFTNPDIAQKAGEDALEELMDEIEEKSNRGEAHDTGTFTFKVLDITK